MAVPQKEGPGETLFDFEGLLEEDWEEDNDGDVVKVGGSMRPGVVQFTVLGQQGVGSNVPSEGQKKPTGQTAHALDEVAPVLLLEVPVGQSVQLAAPAYENEPMGHNVAFMELNGQ